MKFKGYILFFDSTYKIFNEEVTDYKVLDFLKGGDFYAVLVYASNKN